MTKDHDLDIARAELEEFPEKLKRVEKQIEQTSGQLEKCVADCGEKEKELEDIKKRAKELQDITESAKATRDNLGKDFKEKMKLNQKFQEEIKSLDAKIAESRQLAEGLDHDLK